MKDKKFKLEFIKGQLISAGLVNVVLFIIFSTVILIKNANPFYILLIFCILVLSSIGLAYSSYYRRPEFTSDEFFEEIKQDKKNNKGWLFIITKVIKSFLWP